MRKFTKEQIVFVVDTALMAAVDAVEQCLPPMVKLHLITEIDARDKYIAGIEASLGMNLSILWSQTRGQEIKNEGMGVGDAIVSIGWREIVEKLMAERLSFTFHEDDEITIPETYQISKDWVAEQWGDYFDEKPEDFFNESGYELNDEYTVCFPEPGGDIRLIDQYGNHVETRPYDDTDAVERDAWLEWYDLFKGTKHQWFTGLKVAVDDGERKPWAATIASVEDTHILVQWGEFDEHEEAFSPDVLEFTN